MTPSRFLYTSNTIILPPHVTHVQVDETVTELGENAFKELADLVSVELSHTLQLMGKMAFYCCTNLTTVHLSRQLREIPEDAFQSCRKLQDFRLPSKLERIGDRAFFECESITELRCPPTLKVIGRGAFVHCRSLATVNLPETLEYLGDRTFVGCESLQTISIPSGISKIQRGTFSHCHSLTNVQMSEGIEVIGEGVFWCCSSLARVRIPSTVSTIESSAFLYCTSLESVELSYGILYLGQMAFHMCENLLNVALPPSLNDVSKTAFEGCEKLTQLLSSEPEELFTKLRERFDDFSVHRLCYDHQSPILSNAIDGEEYDTIEPADIKRTDSFGMLPYHILSLSTKLNVQLFAKLLEDHDSKDLPLVSEADNFGNCPMDYLCESSESNAIHSIRDILKLAMVNRIELLGLDRWKTDVKHEIENLVYDDDLSTRRKRIHQVYRKLLSLERLESVSLMELAIWNADIKASGIQSGAPNEEERKASRIKSGVQILIPNVVPWLNAPIDDLHFKSKE